MNRVPLFQMARNAALPAVAILIIGYFASAALVGPNGLLALGGYKSTLKVKSEELQRTQAMRDRLRHHANLLDPAKVDPDFGDELVRRSTGQVRPDEIIIPRN
ncbi:FtsB family cell division protein [Sphingomonas sp. SRS2]|uniref:FtsB family cell division protein n=1 Tax=Sphingomonas sp. SRS2 TaxID=133190 RepID=UPI0006183FBB|nr:septation ring formation regulator EzrA [Sphingomonas sp. SRS2]KKC23840.1 septation ring formation regulator EzrA [Sphingomonas sp. SRS2]